jgi:hypothetical protein
LVSILALYWACGFYGLPGAECVAVGWVESRLRTDQVSATGCLGLGQTDSRYSPFPRWSLTTVAGGAWATAHALDYWRDRDSMRYLRAYATGCTGDHGAKVCKGKRRAGKIRAGLRYERAVLSIMRRLGAGGEA